MKIRNLNLNREEIDITKLKIPAGHRLYDVMASIAVKNGLLEDDTPQSKTKEDNNEPK
ncbi:MAG: hypothetical protein J5521_03205 [Lachnospiraceae bacterium]|nr:hypothetical protein [Lachnospiraceae bacterium]MBR4414406.1 hypothetical protein [Aeriscardovia sp.]